MAIHATAALFLVFLSHASGFLVLRPSSARVPSRLQWLSSESSSDDVTYFETQDTLLRIHFAPQQEHALEGIQRYIQSFPYAVILPSQPLLYLPTSDGGVDVKFFQSQHEPGIPKLSGGIRLFLQQDGDRIVVTAKRDDRGRVDDRLAEEKLVVTKLIAGLTGSDDDGLHHVPSNTVCIESIYHKWMLDDAECDTSSIYDEV